MNHIKKFSPDDKQIAIVDGADIIDPTGRRMSINEIRSHLDELPDELALMAEIIADAATPETKALAKLCVATIAAASDRLQACSQGLASMSLRAQRPLLLAEWREMTTEEQSKYESCAAFIRERLEA